MKREKEEEKKTRECHPTCLFNYCVCECVCCSFSFSSKRINIGIEKKRKIVSKDYTTNFHLSSNENDLFDQSSSSMLVTHTYK